MSTFATNPNTRYSDHPASGARGTWFRRAELWLDARGKGAWIAAMVIGFIAFWPVGLALLAYMIFSRRLFSRGGSCARRDPSPAWSAMKPSGNTAFDAYKQETLQRLQNEQSQFEDFLERLRAAKDKAEFDAFMDERSEAAKSRRAADTSDEDA